MAMSKEPVINISRFDQVKQLGRKCCIPFAVSVLLGTLSIYNITSNVISTREYMACNY
jgi:hypothetical protein